MLCPSPGDLPDPGIEPASAVLAAGFSTTKPDVGSNPYGTAASPWGRDLASLGRCFVRWTFWSCGKKQGKTQPAGGAETTLGVPAFPPAPWPVCVCGSQAVKWGRHAACRGCHSEPQRWEPAKEPATAPACSHSLSPAPTSPTGRRCRASGLRAAGETSHGGRASGADSGPRGVCPARFPSPAPRRCYF